MAAFFNEKKSRFIMAELDSQSKFSNLIIAEFSHNGRTFCIMALFYVHNVVVNFIIISLTFEVKKCLINAKFLKLICPMESSLTTFGI
jgi:hypothetical protein